MTKHGQPTPLEQAESQLDLNHLRRETRTALELAIVGLAPTELVDRLATVAGLLEALVELPPNSPPVMAVVPSLLTRARSALEDSQKWRHEHLEKKMPRG